MIGPAVNTSIISSRNLQSVSSDSAPVTPSQDLVLEELKKLARDLMTIRLHMDQQLKGSKTSQDWQMIGIVIDRLLFGLYMVFITVTIITIIYIWIRNSSYTA